MPVATPEEAEELYSNGIKKPILILGYTFPEYDEQIVKEGLRPAVFSLERAKPAVRRSSSSEQRV